MIKILSKNKNSLIDIDFNKQIVDWLKENVEVEQYTLINPNANQRTVTFMSTIMFNQEEDYLHFKLRWGF